MLRQHTHLRGAPSSHHRGVNSFKLVPPARGYGPSCCYEPLRSSPVVEPAGISSVPCRELEFGPSRHCGASYTMAMWPLRDRKTAQVAEWGEGGGEEGGGETESEGGGGGGGSFLGVDGGDRAEGRGLIGGGDKLAFWSKLTTHISLTKF